MVFNIQTYIEDYLQKRAIADPDSYAVRVANLYYRNRALGSEAHFLASLRRVRTLLFTVNRISDRSQFESELLARLDNRFEKKALRASAQFPGGTKTETRRIGQLPRITIEAIIAEFKCAIEARAVDIFWLSRKKGRLRSRPEGIAQALFATFSRAILASRGYTLREFASGVGFVDVGVIVSRSLHIVEFKILKAHFTGPAQVAAYMRNEGRRRAHLVVIDARPPDKKKPIPARVATSAGEVIVRAIDINPLPPSRAG